MRTELFDFDLPKELIAKRPAEPRDSARMLVVAGDDLADRTVRDLPECFAPGDLLVANDTRVLPGLLTGKVGETSVEVTLHRQSVPGKWRAFCRPLRKLRIGDEIHLAEGLVARVVEMPGDDALLDFGLDDAELAMALERVGAMPLPPYIRKLRDPDEKDKRDYQTIFAHDDGAVAAPTAGLHFTPELLTRLEESGTGICKVTLHVGAGTFLPVRADDVREHTMHPEWGEVSEESAMQIRETKARGGRVVAVGTTVLRLLESALNGRGEVCPFRGETRLFILPGHVFRSVDFLLTNFHFPRSTLFMLVAAFSGLRRMQEAYAHAVQERYRFYSYGDATLLAHAGGEA